MVMDTFAAIRLIYTTEYKVIEPLHEILELRPPVKGA